MLNFGDLTKRTVHIGIDKAGHWIEVPMLTVGEFDEYNRIQRELLALRSKSGVTDGELLDAIIQGRSRLADMACRVMPAEYHDGLRRSEYQRLAELVLVLCTGRDDSDDDDPQKKIPVPEATAR